MAKSKFSIENEGLKQLAKQLEELAGQNGLDRAVENSLTRTREYVTSEVEKAISSSKFNFNRTGKTKKTLIKNSKVEWNGSTASIKTGFKLRGEDGVNLTSIYLMYGTNPKNGKGIKPDSNLKNAAKGQGIHRDKINKIQQEEFSKVIQEIMESGND